jgi:hypothetical protein
LRAERERPLLDEREPLVVVRERPLLDERAVVLRERPVVELFWPAVDRLADVFAAFAPARAPVAAAFAPRRAVLATLRVERFVERELVLRELVEREPVVREPALRLRDERRRPLDAR